ncbi:zinc finger BED domain-containing protein RICESLEEPER 1-like [Morus notabilis]|uniref:zinc finger BED domain-containing protein RICESLEEPER 1-like n=1 Tax=Morus notabilis TaxID=981085 RepID=UPI000CED26D6|nr:zinc finger BED domain-containing protein RICESLEEPER 1-like [Morus notabilis]
MTESKWRGVFGKPRKKSMFKSSQMLSRTGKVLQVTKLKKPTLILSVSLLPLSVSRSLTQTDTHAHDYPPSRLTSLTLTHPHRSPSRRFSPQSSSLARPPPASGSLTLSAALTLTVKEALAASCRSADLLSPPRARTSASAKLRREWNSGKWGKNIKGTIVCNLYGRVYVNFGEMSSSEKQKEIESQSSKKETETTETQETTEEEGKCTKKMKKARQRAVSEYIVLDELPFRHVEGKGFKRYSAYLNPRVFDISRITIARDVYQMFLEEKKKLKKVLGKQRVCLMTDTWTSIQNINYMCLTAHWIDEDWNMQKRIINFIQVPNHKGETVAHEILVYLNDWGITALFTVTVDNASSNDVAMDRLKKKVKDIPNFLVLDGQAIHMRCVCHILNLIVNDGLTNLAYSIASIRNAVRNVRSSPQRLKKFKECMKKKTSTQLPYCVWM